MAGDDRVADHSVTDLVTLHILYSGEQVSKRPMVTTGPPQQICQSGL
jgi:hypothetical protein